MSSSQFGCCSHYVKCSDNLNCVNPELQEDCMYWNLNMSNGKVFYGKHANMPADEIFVLMGREPASPNELIVPRLSESHTTTSEVVQTEEISLNTDIDSTDELLDKFINRQEDDFSAELKNYLYIQVDGRAFRVLRLGEKNVYSISNDLLLSLKVHMESNGITCYAKETGDTIIEGTTENPSKYMVNFSVDDESFVVKNFNGWLLSKSASMQIQKYLNSFGIESDIINDSHIKQQFKDVAEASAPVPSSFGARPTVMVGIPNDDTKADKLTLKKDVPDTKESAKEEPIIEVPVIELPEATANSTIDSTVSYVNGIPKIHVPVDQFALLNSKKSKRNQSSNDSDSEQISMFD